MEETEEFPMNELGRQLGIHELTSEIENGERCGLLDDIQEDTCEEELERPILYELPPGKNTICLLLIQP